MNILPLTVACPGCGSKDVVYSCEPDCCFNHVCGNCLNNFELFTKDLGENSDSINIEPEERDSCAPTVECARCRSLKVYQVAESEASAARLVCASCDALLELGFSPV